MVQLIRWSVRLQPSQPQQQDPRVAREAASVFHLTRTKRTVGKSGSVGRGADPDPEMMSGKVCRTLLLEGIGTRLSSQARIPSVAYGSALDPNVSRVQPGGRSKHDVTR